VNAAKAEVIDSIGRKMVDVLCRYARENGYYVVLDSSSIALRFLCLHAIDVKQDISEPLHPAYPARLPPRENATKPGRSKPAPATLQRPLPS